MVFVVVVGGSLKVSAVEANASWLMIGWVTVGWGCH